MTQEQLIHQIKSLKQQKNALILSHNYQKQEIYQIADFIGDSLELARKAAETNNPIIVFCGVDFMAETAKILNPEKIVLLPAVAAKCPMAGMVSAEKLGEMRKKYPKAAVVSYVNTSAEVKAESDICCTSANCVEVVSSLKEEEIIFVPDEHLANYVQSKVKGKKIIPWKGFCYVHSRITAGMIKEAKKNHPNAEVIVHPECPMETIKMADAVCSTSQMIKYAKESKAKEFIIATEEGMVNRLKMEVPGKRFYSTGTVCVQMKKNSLELVKEALLENKIAVEVDEEVAEKARKSLQRMLEIRK